MFYSSFILLSKKSLSNAKKSLKKILRVRKFFTDLHSQFVT